MVAVLKDVGRIDDVAIKRKLFLAESVSGEYSVHLICDTLNIPRGTFYNHILQNKKDNTWYAKRKEENRITIQEIYYENLQIFAAGKIAAIMRNDGIAVSVEMVHRWMKDMKIRSVLQRSKTLRRRMQKEQKLCQPAV